MPGVQLGKTQPRPLALPPKGGSKAPSKAPSPTGSTPATPAAASPSGSGPIGNAADAVRHFADGDVQALLKERATSPSGSAADNDPRGAAGTLPTLQNLVATVNLDTRLELKTIALHARNAEYNPKRFAAVIMRIREPKSTALVFASGKMVVTGTKSEDEAKLAARKFARIIQKLGFEAKFTEFKIQNVVASCDVKFPVRLEGLAVKHGLFSSYEPELFPGLIYRMVKPKVVLLIFVSGKVVLTGAKTREDINNAWSTIYPVLADFRKQQ